MKLGGFENKQNYRIWGLENSHAYIDPNNTLKTSRFWVFGRANVKLTHFAISNQVP